MKKWKTIICISIVTFVIALILAIINQTGIINSIAVCIAVIAVGTIVIATIGGTIECKKNKEKAPKWLGTMQTILIGIAIVAIIGEIFNFYGKKEEEKTLNEAMQELRGE